jgi:ferric-dicitrate binding protein FerR (iron transport regulator)
MGSTGPEQDERRAQREQARLAAASAERLRAELTHARIELELLERRRAHGSPPPATPSAPRQAGPRRRRSFRRNAHGLALGVWLVVFYLLMTLLTQTAPIATGTTVYVPPPVVIGAADTAGR